MKPVLKIILINVLFLSTLTIVANSLYSKESFYYEKSLRKTFEYYENRELLTQYGRVNCSCCNSTTTTSVNSGSTSNNTLKNMVNYIQSGPNISVLRKF